MAKRRTSDGKLFSPWAAIDAADGFCRLSSQFTEALPEDREMTANAAQDFGALTASATNLILAVELYLKAVLIGAELPVPWTHDLVELFKSLPENWRTGIEARYNARAGGTPDVTSSLRLYVRLAKPVEGIEAIRNPVDQSLPSLLERNRSAFITWRYIHEGMSRDKVEVYEYEFRRLKLICELLREQLVASLPSK